MLCSNELLNREKKLLYAFDYDLLSEYINDPISRIVSTESMVQFWKRKYSGPIKYTGEEVGIRLTTEFIRVYYNGELILTHPICDKKSSCNYHPENTYEILKSDILKHEDDKDIYPFI